ncbi:hypothetical protein J6590_077021 [Homalodisca vitripennis]|nr:hypothetical protein J6590_077021 [Homalodisca vitripennis]
MIEPRTETSSAERRKRQLINLRSWKGMGRKGDCWWWRKSEWTPTHHEHPAGNRLKIRRRVVHEQDLGEVCYKAQLQKTVGDDIPAHIYLKR